MMPMDAAVMTIDELAQRVAMSSRNIREWQRQGLLPPPARRGRIGVYSDQHVSRIEHVQKLHAQGLPLDLIRRLIDASGGDETDIRQLASEVLMPFSTRRSTTLTREELTDRLGSAAVTTLARLGLIAADTDISVRDKATLDLLEGLTDVGISLDRMVTVLTEVEFHQRAIARLLLDAYVDDVWQPFVASGFTTPGWGPIAEAVTRAKPLAVKLIAHMLEVALDDVAGPIMVHEANQAEQLLHAEPAADAAASPDK